MVNLVSIETTTQESTGLALCERQQYRTKKIFEGELMTRVKDVRKKNESDKFFIIMSILIIFISIIGSGIINYTVISTTVKGNTFAWLNRYNISGLEINRFIKDCFMSNNLQKVYDFYNKYIGNIEISYSLVNNAIENNIPINKLIALARCESEFNPRAKNKNVNGSTDYGIMQLNGNTYKELLNKYGEDYLMNPATNISIGAQHLLSCYKICKNWDQAILMYNAGANIINKSVPWTSVVLLTKVISIEQELDQKFNNDFN